MDTQLEKENIFDKSEGISHLRNTLLYAILTGVGTIIVYAAFFYSFKIFALCFIIALAAFSASFFIGILFGMPKRKGNEEDSYALNNSLVEISEWLTKIIVGLSLVNLIKIPGYLRRFGEYMIRSTDSDSNTSIDVFSVSILIYFGFLGLFYGYNYMRLFLSLQYRLVDDELLDVKAELESNKEQVKVLENQTSVMRELANESLQSENEIKQLYNVVAQDVPRIEELKNIASERAKVRGSLVPDDPHKGKWGGSSEKNSFRLTGTVKELFLGLYEISLEVSSIDPVQHPLNEGDIVIFALHPSFKPEVRLVKVVEGSSRLKVVAYGSFTVGVFADSLGTELELDLAQLPGVSDYFKTH